MVEMSRKMVWPMVGLLIVVLVSATAFATSSNWQKSGKLLTARTMTLRELFTTLGKPVPGILSSSLGTKVYLGPVHKYMIHPNGKVHTNASSSDDIWIYSRSWIAPQSFTVPTQIYYGTYAFTGPSYKLNYMNITAVLTEPNGTNFSAYSWGLFTDEVDASGERLVNDPGDYTCSGSYYYFDLIAGSGSGPCLPVDVYLVE